MINFAAKSKEHMQKQEQLSEVSWTKVKTAKSRLSGDTGLKPESLRFWTGWWSKSQKSSKMPPDQKKLVKTLMTGRQMEKKLLQKSKELAQIKAKDEGASETLGLFGLAGWLLEPTAP